MQELIAFTKWCDHLPLAEQAAALKEAGFDGLDMPCRLNSAITHATAPEKLPEAKRIIEDHGLKLTRLVCDIVDEKDDVADRFLGCIAELGIRKIRAGGFSVPRGENVREILDKARKRMETLEKLLEKHGVSAGIQNHSGNSLDVNISSVLHVISGRNPKWIGIQYDPGHLTLSGEPPHIALGLMGEYLHSVNFKSPRQDAFIRPQTGRLAYVPSWVPLRSGMLDVPLVLEELKKAGYTEAISIHCEYRSFFFRMEQNVEDVNRVVKEDVDYLREELKQL
jgi:L-ribulose-5-phosphate 3-epimerase